MLNFQSTDKGSLWIFSEISKRKHRIKCDNIEEIWLMGLKNLRNNQFHIKWIQEEYNIDKSKIMCRATNWKGRVNLIILLVKSIFTLNFHEIKTCFRVFRSFFYKNVK